MSVWRDRAAADASLQRRLRLFRRSLSVHPGRALLWLAALVAIAVAIPILATSRAGHATPSAAAGKPAHASAPLAVQPVRLSAPPELYWGASISLHGAQAPWQMDAVRSFTRDAGKGVSLINWGSSFYSLSSCNGYCRFETAQFQAVRSYGAIPVFSWAPGWSRDVDARVAAGAFDPYITEWARAAKAWGHPFFLRFAWEMNGDWFPWGVGARGQSSVGNTAASYVAMWRHVHEIFARVGATNVSWVWCPNINASTTYSPLSALYPGNAYVNWTCLDGYNGDNPWASFGALYGESYRQITQFAPGKPMMVGEVSSTEAGGSKAAWITNMFETLPSLFPDIRGLIWDEEHEPGPGGHEDWEIESSPQAESAFREVIAGKPFVANDYQHLASSPIPPPGPIS